MVEQLKVACQSDSPLLFGEFEENTIIDFDAFDRTKLYRETSFKLTDTLEVQMEKAVKWVKETFEI